MDVWIGRRSPRLAGYDYREPGLYFVTICTRERQTVLSDIVDCEVHLTAAGSATLAAWEELHQRFPGIELDALVIMPNHIHGILVMGSNPDLPQGKPMPGIATIVRAFKSISGIRGNRVLGRSGQPFWQRSFHDRIIRSARELELIRFYIADNPGAGNSTLSIRWHSWERFKPKPFSVSAVSCT